MPNISQRVAIMGKYTAIGMRTAESSLPDKRIVINTCGKNDTAEKGDMHTWVWCNPTNRAITHKYEDIEAVSVECLWQGTKILTQDGRPDALTLSGNWRRGKGKRPVGAYNGPNRPLITSPGAARRAIYLPAFKNLIDHWMKDSQVQDWVAECEAFDGHVFLRDHDTGRGLDRNGPMSHAWLLCMYLNNKAWPS